MAEDIKIVSLNCRGLSNCEKLRDYLSKFREQRFDIILLQDTHWDADTLKIAREIWDYEMISTTFDTRSRGAAIIFNNSFEFELGDSIIDPSGNYVFTELSLPSKISIILGSIYAPNQDEPVFITNLIEKIERYENPNIILGGDWNSTRDFEKDNLNYVQQNNIRTTRAIDNMNTTLNLVDPWRILKPQKRKYTWWQGISQKQARLDYFLCSEELLSITKDYNMLPKYRSDHSPIILKLKHSSSTRGPGTWKMNNSLLMDDNFVTLIKKSINDIKRTYAATPYNPNFVEATTKNLELMINPILFWETMLVTLRGIIIDYARRKKRIKNAEMKNLETGIQRLDDRITSGLANARDIEQLNTMNNDLITLRKEVLMGAYIRSRAEWVEYGEKPSKYFLNLENKNRINKNIDEIKKDEHTTITEQSEILKNIKEFYESLYKKKEHARPNQPDLAPDNNRLTDDEMTEIDQPLTKEELDNALKQMKNNKSPGMDGFSPEFYKKIWPQLGYFFLNCAQECFKRGELTESQTQGLITCLPKTGKARNLLKNWRPISLLNTTYKLISACITNRIRKILDKLISSEQKGFIPGRTISDCSRLMYDIIFSCQNLNIDGLILLIDFEKAFDSLSWPFIHETLKKFNFGPNLQKWVKILQYRSNSRIILNGHLSEPFYLERGCRQGDPLSPYLFILCAETLTLAFKQSRKIEGITIYNKEHRLSLYADDTSIFIKATEANLKHSLEILEWFYQKSGLKMNMSKTKVIRIGPIRETDRRFCRENNLDWVSKFTALGINYDTLNLNNITELNIETKMQTMEKMMQQWQQRNITPMGRVTVYKSLILSKIIHLLQALPSPKRETITNIERLATNFIWRGKRHEINNQLICASLEQGGLNMFNLSEFDKSLKISWLQKIHTQEPDWKEFALKYKIDRLI